MIVLISAVSVGIAYFVASSIFGGASEQSVKVKSIDPITSSVESPDSAIFNENAINPSVEVNINNTPDAVDTTPAPEPANTSTDEADTDDSSSSTP